MGHGGGGKDTDAEAREGRRTGEAVEVDAQTRKEGRVWKYTRSGRGGSGSGVACSEVVKEWDKTR